MGYLVGDLEAYGADERPKPPLLPPDDGLGDDDLPPPPDERPPPLGIFSLIILL